MTFITALKLTIGLLFVRAILSKIFPIINENIIGNAVFSFSVFYSFIYLTIKQFKIDKIEICPMNSISRRYLFGISTSIISIYLATWLLMEAEVITKDGTSVYFQNREEIFKWSHRQKFFLTALVVSPIFEEVFFRGLLLNSLRKYYSTKGALILTSILFSISHLKIDNTFISSLIYSFSSGVFYGWVLIRFNDIRITIYSHFLWNLLVYLFPIFMIFTGYSVDSLNAFGILALMLLVLSGICAFISIKFLYESNLGIFKK